MGTAHPFPPLRKQESSLTRSANYFQSYKNTLPLVGKGQATQRVCCRMSPMGSAHPRRQALGPTHQPAPLLKLWPGPQPLLPL